MPDIIGNSKEGDADADIDVEPSLSVASPSILPQALNKISVPTTAKFVPPVSFYGAPPLKVNSKGPLFASFNIVYPDIVSDSRLYRHDPAVLDAVIMKSPTKEHAKKFNKKYVVTLATND